MEDRARQFFQRGWCAFERCAIDQVLGVGGPFEKREGAPAAQFDIIGVIHRSIFVFCSRLVKRNSRVTAVMLPGCRMLRRSHPSSWPTMTTSCCACAVDFSHVRVMRYCPLATATKRCACSTNTAATSAASYSTRRSSRAARQRSSKRWPGSAAIFTGGDAPAPPLRELIANQRGVFLHKPFPGAALVRAVAGDRP